MDATSISDLSPEERKKAKQSAASKRYRAKNHARLLAKEHGIRVVLKAKFAALPPEEQER